MRAALLAVLIVSVTMQPAAADGFYREDLRISMAAAETAGLEAMLVRPSGSGRFPLALISHGAPRDHTARATMSPYGTYRQAIEFARRGFAALVVMRRDYGDSGGRYAESNGRCANRDYLRSARASAEDLAAAIRAMQDRTDVSTNGMIAVGSSAGGFASIALAATAPPGLVAAISFAGGRGSRADDDVCDEAALVRAFAALGRTSRIPMLWIYAENDKFFRPDLAHRMHAAFTGAGGRAELIDAPAFGDDGHTLFSRGIALWTPMVDRFLQEQNLGTRELAAAPLPAALSPPPRLGEKGRSAFEAYLAASPHKAFAVSPTGGFGYRAGQRSAVVAQDAALAACAKAAADCAVYAVDEELVERERAGAR
ncbi:S9 family peptidase [Bradyrhizobium sp. AUGA SZCCT0431]|uniref:alpha/beta hydrolase family protein n=1 Tax=Bradyrhizobium sp. AUGA SZCCT0431 TaxID=2807674 RepID=UPI001BA4A776|nr:CocE/NonD family hydrolase [Bradyrhizobium sp. AUGA SZCCT0431]MBR1142301.1 dienelactone hydrolase family protein [Bradyrhizobium sp. AUGA SZCCT0431]